MFMSDNIIKANWRPAAAVIFLVICIFDFLVMPAVFLNFEEHRDYSAIYAEAHKFTDPQVQVAIINKIELKITTWQPLTLQGGGMFFIAFGGILTGAAITRGNERTAIARRRKPIVDDSDRF